MFRLIEKIFKELTISIINVSNHIKCVSLSNQKCMTQPAPINLHPNEHSQEFHYYPFAVKVCVPDKTEDLNLSVFNMITRINELKTLTKHISCECKCKFDGRNCNPDQWWNNENVDVSVKNVMYVKKILFGILLHVIVKIPYLPSIMDDSAIMCDQIIESY